MRAPSATCTISTLRRQPSPDSRSATAFVTMASGLSRRRPTPRTPQPQPRPRLNYVSARQAAQIDARLMSPQVGHTLEQLMELAGLCVALAAHDLQADACGAPVTVLCGPGNNGGDGLVAARHLHAWGHSVCVVQPRVRNDAPFAGLQKQLVARGVPVDAGTDVPTALAAADGRHASGGGLLVDAVFGFSFAGGRGVREPFGDVLRFLRQARVPVLAIDVPSGWDVERGDVYDCSVGMPDAVVSLTMPKLCMSAVDGASDVDAGGNGDGGQGGAGRAPCVHYVGGRFVPSAILEEMGAPPPTYPGADQIVRVR